ncbi:hypothetical protein O979_05695 [Mycobacterium avium subsp. paratuberculosis 10-4404]|nr:hypothetical protein O979_05695 [Mycobacterium avium subsp. paratuberculosis 10-4404]ETB13465.1 hypothetical protein O980_05610 [Mycobacterium avium subsp. paratuberculosis 08-8281]
MAPLTKPRITRSRAGDWLPWSHASQACASRRASRGRAGRRCACAAVSNRIGRQRAQAVAAAG